MGCVIDVYISPHLSKLGKRFGFVRFVDIKNDQEILQQLNDTWFGYYKLFASVPRFPKQPHKPRVVQAAKPIPNMQNMKPTLNTLKSTVEKRNDAGNSYASVVSGKANSHSQPIHETEEVVLELLSGDFVVDNRMLACYGKARDFPTLPNLRLLCMDEGFEEVELRYVGGLWVLFEFPNAASCTNFMNNESMDHWLSEKRVWDRNFVPKDRVVWLDIECLPIRAWSKSAFRKIVSKWGVVLHLDDALGEDVYKNRVCILTTHQNIISEALNIRVDGMVLW